MSGVHPCATRVGLHKAEMSLKYDTQVDTIFWTHTRGHQREHGLGNLSLRHTLGIVDCFEFIFKPMSKRRGPSGEEQISNDCEKSGIPVGFVTNWDTLDTDLNETQHASLKTNVLTAVALGNV